MSDSRVDKTVYELANDLYSSHSYIKLKSQYDERNLWNIFNKTSNEPLHTKFIKFLLDPSENYSIDTFALEQLLRLLVIKNQEQNVNNETLLKLQNQLFTGTSTNLVCEEMHSEYRIPSESSIFDIFSTLSYSDVKFSLIIENKVTSTENDKEDCEKAQTTKYVRASKNLVNPILVYLSVDDEQITEEDKFVRITYQELLDYVIEPALLYSTDEKSTNLISDYIKVLSRIDKGKGSEIIMAMSHTEKELLKEIYTSNKDLFERMFNVIKEEPDTTVEEKEAIDTIIAYNNNRNSKWLYKDRTYNNRELVTTIVIEQLSSGVPFEKLEQYKMHSKPMVIKDRTGKETLYNPITVNDVTYYIRNCCDESDVQKLIDGLEIDAQRINV